MTLTEICLHFTSRPWRELSVRGRGASLLSWSSELCGGRRLVAASWFLRDPGALGRFLRDPRALVNHWSRG